MNYFSDSRFGPLFSIAMVLLALIALVYAVTALPVETLSEVRIQGVAPWFIPAIVLLHLAYLVMSAEVWRRLVHTITGKPSNFSDAYLQMTSVAAGKYIPGKVWGFVARTGQMSRIAVPAGLSILTSVIEQLAVLIGGGIVVVGSAFLVFPEYWPVVALAGVALLIGLVVLSRHVPDLVAWVQRRRGIEEESPRDVSGELIRWLRFSFAYAILWLISGLILCVIYFSLFDGVVTVQTLAALVFANTIGFIVGFLAVFAPGGLGVREAITVAALSPFVPMREALIAAIALRALMVLFDGINCGFMIIAEMKNAARRSD